jgi:hypothetical protein
MTKFKDPQGACGSEIRPVEIACSLGLAPLFSGRVFGTEGITGTDLEFVRADLGKQLPSTCLQLRDILAVLDQQLTTHEEAQMKSRMVSFLPGLMILLTIFVWVGSTLAAPPSLKGDYAFTGEASCLSSTTVKGGTPQSPSGFTDLKVSGPSFIDSFSVQGVRAFNGDGTGTVSGTSVGITYDDSSPSASSQTFTFSFTYTIQPDGTIATDLVPGSYLGTIVAGPRAGQTITINDFFLAGIPSADNKTLTLATPSPPTVETLTFSNGDVQERICHRSRVLIWMGAGSSK